MPLDHRPPCTRGGGQCHGDARRIDMAVFEGLDGSPDVRGPVERIAPGHFPGSDQRHGQVQQPAHAHDGLHPIHLIVGGGNAKAAHPVPSDALTGFRLGPLIDLDRFLVDPAHDPAAHRMGDLTRGVPGGAAGEFPLFEEDRVGPPVFGQLVLDRDSHDPAADDGHPRGPDCVRHAKASFAGLREARAANRVQAISTSKPGTMVSRASRSSGAVSIASATERPKR